MRRRAMLGGLIHAAWLAGIGVLIHHEYFRPQLQQLAEIGIRINPGVVYFGVMKNGQQVGFASSTIDTTQAGITLSDYFVADTTAANADTAKEKRRTAEWTDVTLTRGMRVSKFDTELDGDGPPKLSAGRFLADSVLLYGIGTLNQSVDSQRVAMSSQVLLPNLAPLAMALMAPPKVGKHYLMPMFDPRTMQQQTMTLRIVAESVFAVTDSAVYDSTAKRWKPARTDTVRAWRVAADSNRTVDGWFDEQGRVVQKMQRGFVLQRMAYELAFENWKADSLHKDAIPASGGAFRAEIERSPAVQSADAHQTMLPSLQLSLSGMDLSGLALNVGRQRLSHDTLFVGMDDLAGVGTQRAAIQMDSDFARKRLAGEIPPGDTARMRERAQFAQRVNPVISDVAKRLAAGTRDEAEFVRRAVYWVHDSIANGPGNLNVLDVFAGKKGDAIDHVRLLMTILRASGIPTRFATGLHYADRAFYYHVWCDVLFSDAKWIAVDPTFGEFPADAAHVFLSTKFTNQAAFLRLVAPLRITVLSVGTPVALPPRRPPSK